MEIHHMALAGTLESNDAMIEVSPAEEGVTVEIESIVYRQFADMIEQAVRGVLQELGVKRCTVRVNDHGALDCVIRARTETAALRAAEEKA